MLSRIGAKLAGFLLNRGSLSIEDSLKLSRAILKNLGALPFRDIISIDNENHLVINGKPLDIEQARQLHESAIAALQNKALNIIRDQVRFAAITHGIHKAEQNSQIFFARAALWIIQEELKFLETLAQRTHEEPTL